MIRVNGDIEFCHKQIVLPSSMDRLDFSRYVFEPEIVDTARKYYSLPSSVYILSGCGVTDLIAQLLHPSLGKYHHGRVSCTYPYFAEGLDRLLASSGLTVRFIILEDDNSSSGDVASLSAALSGWEGMLLMANPSNPSGRIISRPALVALMDSLSGVLFVVDETFILCEPGASLLPELESRSNLAILRGFSKGEGLAGLRLGFLLTNNMGFVEQARRSRIRYFSEFQVKQLEYLMTKPEVIAHNVEYRLREKLRIAQSLASAGFKVLPTATHFVLVDLGHRDKVKRIVELAKATGIELSYFLDLFGLPCVQQPLMEKYVRITPLDKTSNSRVIQFFIDTRKELVTQMSTINPSSVPPEEVQ